MQVVAVLTCSGELEIRVCPHFAMVPIELSLRVTDTLPLRSCPIFGRLGLIALKQVFYPSLP